MSDITDVIKRNILVERDGYEVWIKAEPKDGGPGYEVLCLTELEVGHLRDMLNREVGDWKYGVRRSGDWVDECDSEDDARRIAAVEGLTVERYRKGVPASYWQPIGVGDPS